MKIANPMYDVVFKYLIEDHDCARLLLGEIIQQEILECELLHNEIASEILSDSIAGVLKMDFKALVKTTEGKHLLVIIEVQKALKETNLQRFRQYLGSQYSNKNNVYQENDKRIPLPIFSIYILGYNIGLANEIPIIKVSPRCFDYTEGTELQQGSTFTDSLSHEMVIIQTKVLKHSRRSLLERFLSNFMPEVQQFLEVNPSDFDRKYVSLLKRLETATMKKEIVELMQRENLLQEEWNDMVRSKEEAMKLLEKERGEKEEERKLKEEALKQKEGALTQQEEERKQKEEALKQKDEVLKISVLSLLDLGLSKREVAEKLSISETKIDEFAAE
jgi:hypothetical protein